MLAKVKKHSGVLQEFDKAKLKTSLKKAGAKEEHATKVADKVAGKVNVFLRHGLILVFLRQSVFNPARLYSSSMKPTIALTCSSLTFSSFRPCNIKASFFLGSLLRL
jgi:hypothetical protein